jgi:hypothetical protein
MLDERDDRGHCPALCQSPSNVAVEGNPKWFRELAVKLELLKIFNTLSRSLNLRKK